VSVSARSIELQLVLPGVHSSCNPSIEEENFDTCMSALLEAQHVYGNFQSYYDFHPAVARSALLPKDLFRILWKEQGSPTTFKLFDVGCNEGDLTLMLLRLAREQLPDDVHVVAFGVDIDTILIERARKKGVELLSSMLNAEAKFVAADFMLDNNNYNLSHYTGKLNFVSIFSVTMWVHLNHGDAGLRLFFDRACALLASKGVILVEPQSWRSYKTARKRALKLQLPEPKYWATITLKRPEQDIDDICLKRFSSVLYLGKEMWSRSLSIYSNVSLQLLFEPPVESKKRSGFADEESGEGMRFDQIITKRQKSIPSPPLSQER
jgi:SAM-dependent methyltransferase